MGVHNAFYNGKSYTHAFFLAGICSSVKNIKNIIKVFFVYAVAAVLYFKDY
jgi:hypothetical protein